jgi:endonuclease/exonuclease/phosphatase family metal-dependent hydrolase
MTQGANSPFTGPSDLHLHSNHSDGTETPAEVVRQAHAHGIRTLALTDHDRTTGWVEAGDPMWVHHVNIRPDVKNGPQAWQTTILISAKLGEYSVIASSRDGSSNTSSVPSAVAMPVDGSGPTIVAVHAVAPRQDAMERWRSDLAWIADQCPAGDFILAGDFNATLDHMSSLRDDGGTMGRCHDAASSTGNGMMGTWPASVPALLSTPIDHVMASENWRATGSEVLDDAGGSDHRALVVQLEPAG